MAIKPIRLAYSTSTPQELVKAPEGATQTFPIGAPVKLSSGCVVIADSNWASADVVYGIAAEPGHNLTTANTAQPAVSEATPPNQASAVTIPVGAWIRDGSLLMYKADGKNVFLASLKDGQTFAQTLVAAGTYYKLTYDSTSTNWYVDNTTTSGNGAVCEIIGGVSDDTTMCLFRFKAAQRFFD